MLFFFANIPISHAKIDRAYRERRAFDSSVRDFAKWAKEWIVKHGVSGQRRLNEKTSQSSA